METKSKTIKSINHHSRRTRPTITYEPSMVDESLAKDTDINIIMARYRQTGQFPLPTRAPQYLDATTLPSFQEAKNIVANAHSEFQNYPSELRVAMKNDPANAFDFFQDPKNTPLLEKYGLVTRVPSPTPSEDPKKAPIASKPPSEVPGGPSKTPKGDE